jgi:CTP synthase (UTP-ammonia lyase)
VAAGVRIGVIGDFVPGMFSHTSINDSLGHASEALSVPVQYEWVPTTAVPKHGAAGVLERFDAIWTAPNSPYRSFDGMLAAIEFARTRDWPYVGT